MARANRICYMCNKSYHYCPTCAEDRNKPSWYNMFCSEVCKDLNDILSENNFGRISNEDASELLKKICIPEIDNPDNKRKIEELLTYKKKPVKKVKPIPISE